MFTLPNCPHVPTGHVAYPCTRPRTLMLSVFAPRVCMHACAVQEAVDLTARCLQRAAERGADRHAACRVTADVLTKVAVDRGSFDNVTAIVVDLECCT